MSFLGESEWRRLRRLPVLPDFSASCQHDNNLSDKKLFFLLLVSFAIGAVR
jgi:hypothetical protein